MSVATLILGNSGSGKSTSLRNLKPENTLLIQCITKTLPFRNGHWEKCNKENPHGSVLQVNGAASIVTAMQRTSKDVIVIDDYQAILVNELMSRSSETGYGKFTDIAKGVWNVFQTAGSLPESKRIYIMAHTQTDELGQVRMKTVGKMVDSVLVPEGYFTIVLRTEVVNGNYLFSTQTNGQDCCKSPIDMFAEQQIPNDLASVDASICEYYGIQA